MKNEGNENKISDVKVHYLSHYLTGEDILDVGAGRCYYSEWVLKNNPELNVVALDHMDLAQVNGIKFFKSNLENPIPFADNSFSTIMAFDIIEHITNEEQLIKELFRICKPNGILLGSVPHDNDKFLPAYNLTFYHRSDLTHKRYYIESTLKQSLQKGGFLIQTIDLRGGVSPQVIAEFFPRRTHFFVKKFVGILRRIGIIKTHMLASDLFFIARKQVQT